MQKSSILSLLFAYILKFLYLCTRKTFYTMRKTIICMLSVALLACTNAAKQPKLEDECLYSSQQTQFAFWSNAAEQMEVLIYDEANSNEPTVVSLTKGDDDFWKASVEGDLAGKFYTVRSFQNGEWAPEWTTCCNPRPFPYQSRRVGVRRASCDDRPHRYRGL